MARYVDGFVFPVPKKNVAAYRRLASGAGRIWRKHGALEYFECVGDDLKTKGTGSFLKQCKAKPSEMIIFSWIVYKSRAHRDQVNTKVMNDPRLMKLCDPKKPLFNVKQMLVGGFKVLVEF